MKAVQREDDEAEKKKSKKWAQRICGYREQSRGEEQ